MRFRFTSLILCLFVAGGYLLAAAANKPSENEEDLPPQLKALIDDHTAEVLRRINSVNAYETPDLKLRKNSNYARLCPEVSDRVYVWSEED